MNTLRETSAAGMFYPSDKKQLKELINGLLYFGKSDVKADKISGIIVPHAGYIYSGKTAAYAYNLLKNRNYKTVVIISPSHREYFSGISIFSGKGYKTPFGDLLINHEITDRLTEGASNIFKGIQGHREEHAVEVHLPFLQSVLNDFMIVPIVMGDQSKLFVDELAQKLSEVYTEDMLIVASSDLSHYHTKETAGYLDSVVEKDIAGFNYDLLMHDLEINKCEACGGGPVVALMKALALKGFNKSIVLNRSDSGDVTRDKSQVVGYLSAAIYS